MKFSFVLAPLVVLLSCSDSEQVKKIEDYEGPTYELVDVKTLYSTKKDENTAFVEYKLEAARQLIFENEDMEFPEGVYIESYQPDGNIAFILEANEGYYDQKEDVYRAVGDVNLRNLQEKQSLTTEELFWKPGAGDESIYTDKFVIIETVEEKIYGEGLRASQDFERYVILKPTGSLAIDEYQ